METNVRKHKRNLGRKETTVRQHSRSLANPNYKPKTRTPFKPTKGRRMSFDQMEKRTKRLSPYTDIDGDGKVNRFDCHPLDSTRQDDMTLFMQRRRLRELVKDTKDDEELSEELRGRYQDQLQEVEEEISEINRKKREFDKKLMDDTKEWLKEQEEKSDIYELDYDEWKNRVRDDEYAEGRMDEFGEIRRKR